MSQGDRELALSPAERFLAVAKRHFGPFALGQINHKVHSLIRRIANGAPPISTGTRLPSFRKYSFSYGCTVPVRLVPRSARRRARAIPAASDLSTAGARDEILASRIPQYREMRHWPQ